MADVKKWFVQPRDLVTLTPKAARDLITRCFFEAQKETFAQAGHHLGQAPTDDDLRGTIEGAIRLAFRETGHDYEDPTKQALEQVVEVLARKSAAWQTPPQIIQHHKEQIGKVLANIK